MHRTQHGKIFTFQFPTANVHLLCMVLTRELLGAAPTGRHRQSWSTSKYYTCLLDYHSSVSIIEPCTTLLLNAFFPCSDLLSISRIYSTLQSFDLALGGGGGGAACTYVISLYITPHIQTQSQPVFNDILVQASVLHIFQPDPKPST